MKCSIKKKTSGPAMLPALHQNGIAGIAVTLGFPDKRFNGCVSIHQMLFPIIYFRMKKGKHVACENKVSNIAQKTV